MTRKPPSLAWMTMLALLVCGADAATAQFGIFFPQQRSQQRSYRPRPRPSARKPAASQPAPRQAVPVQPLRPEPVFPLDVEVPLPPPRPRFPGDPPEAQIPAEVPPSAGEVKGPGEPERKPADETKPPSELVKPNMPSRPEPPTVAPRPDTAPGPKPSMTVKPVPDELPPKGPASSDKPNEPPPAPRPGPEPTKPEPTKREPTKPESKPKAPPSAAAPSPVPVAPVPPSPPLPPEKPAELKPGAPSGLSPGIAPSGARLGETPRSPEDDASCESRLTARGVSLDPATIGPQPDERCTVVRPVHLLALNLPGGGKVEFPEHPTIACTTADAFSTYVRDLLSPLAKGALGSQVTAVWTGPGLECRSRDHIVGAKLSAHGQGLAIDIAQLKLADGRKLEVGREKNEATQTFEIAARRGACGYFHTVLGPGTDAFHATHWHFDLIVRGAQGDNKYCR